ncbi:hypothetical protein HZS_6699 [Henneguya salminicola]|nr:hypothetical protein HZS_6699 [Henneguya salminicola]
MASLRSPAIFDCAFVLKEKNKMRNEQKQNFTNTWIQLFDIQTCNITNFKIMMKLLKEQVIGLKCITVVQAIPL